MKLAARRAGLDFEEGRWLSCAYRGGAHARLGYGSFVEYAERLFGYSPRLTQEKLRVAEALEALPITAWALQIGQVSFSAARELTRVATPETEREWLEAAQGKTVREVERMVSGHRPGNRPNDLPDSGAKRHVLRFEVSGEVLATFREAMAKIRREAGDVREGDLREGDLREGRMGALDDDALILLLARQVLGGPRDEGRSSYQVALTICEGCLRGFQLAQGDSIEVPAVVVEMASCDAQHIGRVDGDSDAHTRAQLSSLSDSHVGAPLSDPHVGASPHPPRAAQQIPPAVRRAVLRRDGGRCKVPGCRHATFVDVHHLKLRSDGGSNEAENLITLCSAHHRASHNASLLIEGSPARGLVFRHADGTPYVGVPSPDVTAIRAKACQVLQTLGFREKAAKCALARVPADPQLELEQVIRAALRATGGP